MKVQNTLGPLVQGVSQQAPELRRPGQHGEQINMIADAVDGLSRRHGSIWQAEMDLQLDPENAAANFADSVNWRSFDYSNAGRDFTVLHRTSQRASGSDAPAVVVFDKTNRQFLTLVRAVGDTAIDALTSGGISAITAVGKYVFMAGNTLVPTGTSNPVWADATNQARTVLWVRGGAYSRKFSVTVTKVGGGQVSFDYTTPASSYPGTLDTSSVPVFAADPAGGTQTDTEAAYIKQVGAFAEATLTWASWSPTSLSVKDGGTTLTNVSPADPTTPTQYRWDAGSSFVRFHPSLLGQLDVSITYTHTKVISNPNYTKAVADITNAYNTAVTAWIGSSSAAIQPAAIAQSLRDAATAAGLIGVSVVGSTVVFTDVIDITDSDGGDGTLLRGLASKAQSVDDLTDTHFVGKVVRVSPTGEEAFYMKAVAKDTSVTSGVTKVQWVEGAGIERTITYALCYGIASGNTFYIAGSAAILATLLPGDHPDYAKGTVGDDDSSPMPYFVGRKISYLGVFQDRLLVGADAVIRGSRTGDYLNFFRSSVLTVLADDPFQMLSQGSEDDTIRYSVLYDKDLILFGNRQYAVSGRTPLTPTSANMPVMSSHAGAADAPPIAAGVLIFYVKAGQEAVSVHQLEPGRNPESPESFTASSQLSDYMPGNPVELVGVPKPSTLLVRTSGARHTLFVFSYLDSNQGRQQDCWDRWDYAEVLGPIIGVSIVRDGVLVFTLRQVADIDGDLRQYVVADLQPLDRQLSRRPYLDSMQPYATISATPGSMHLQRTGVSVAYDKSTPAFLLGVDALADVPQMVLDVGHATGLQAGVQSTALWVPTNPFIRDGDGNVINAGRLIVTSLMVGFKDSSGFESVVTAYGQSQTFRFNGRILGDVNNIVGRVPVTSGKQSVPIGRSSSEYTQVIKALTWLPLNLKMIDWTGQKFNRAPRG